MKETEKLLRKTANQLSQKHISWVEGRNDNYIVLYKHIYSCKCMLFLVKNLFPTWHFNFLESSTRWKANQPVKLFWHTRWVLKEKIRFHNIFWESHKKRNSAWWHYYFFWFFVSFYIHSGLEGDAVSDFQTRTKWIIEFIPRELIFLQLKFFLIL